MRPSFTSIYLDIAALLKGRSTCLRRAVGSVFVDTSNHIVGTGYNGAPAGMKHCTEVGCHLIDGHCSRSVHAEINGIFNAPDPTRLRGGTLYQNGGTPCYRCAQALISTGVAKVICVAPEIYDLDAWGYLAEAGLICTRTEMYDEHRG